MSRGWLWEGVQLEIQHSCAYANAYWGDAVSLQRLSEEVQVEVKLGKPLPKSQKRSEKQSVEDGEGGRSDPKERSVCRYGAVVLDHFVAGAAQWQ